MLGKPYLLPETAMPPADDAKPKGHTLDDHTYGIDLEHTHDGYADHDHDFPEDGPLEENPIWIQDHVTLTSVGIDIGSSGTQVIFSRIHLRRLGEDLSSPIASQRMIGVEIRDARQPQELAGIVIRLYFERPPVGLDRLNVALQLLPARKAVASGEHALRVIQSESRRVGRPFMVLDFGECACVAGTVGFVQILRLTLQLVEVRPVRPLAD